MNLVYAILAGLLPALIWLLFWTSEDSHPEPKPLLFRLFIAGAIAVAFAAFAEDLSSKFITDTNILYAVWAGIEEVLKFIVVVVIALGASSNDEPIDAMIYFITVAIGFAAVENILFIMGPMADNDITKGLITGNFRFIGATLVHVVCSAIIGFSYGLVFYKSHFAKLLALLIGLGFAIATHALFNITITEMAPLDILKAFAGIWAGAVVLILLFEEVKHIRPKYV